MREGPGVLGEGSNSRGDPAQVPLGASGQPALEHVPPVQFLKKKPCGGFGFLLQMQALRV